MWNRLLRRNMSFVLGLATMCIRHIDLRFSGVLKRWMYLIEQFRDSSSSLSSSNGMSFRISFKTTLRERSSGRAKVWNSVLFISSVL